MVLTSDNNIVSAFTGCVSVKAIYTYGVYVWPISYYISWTPSDVSGTFTIDGHTYNLEDYGGYFEGFNGVIGSDAFRSTKIVTVETNAFSISDRAFRDNYSSLLSVSLSQCRIISSNAFADCHSMNSFYAPECISVGKEAFWACDALVTVSLPKCRYLDHHAFGSCDILQSVYLPQVSFMGSGIFQRCDSLRTVIMPPQTQIPSVAFLWDHLFESIDLTSCSYIGDNAFGGCSVMQDVSTPVLESIGYAAFAGCYSLTHMNMPVCSFIANRAFVNCTSLSELILGYSGVCYLEIGESDGVSKYMNFSGTPLSYGSGSIYVPSSLVSAYKSNDGWKSLKNIIYPIPN